MRSRLFRFLFVAHFFLPYLAGSRIRLDVLVAYACVVLLPLRLKGLTRAQRFYLASWLACGLWAAARIMFADQTFTDRITGLTFSTFPLTAFATYLFFRPWLGTMEELVDDALLVSIPINFVAFEQARDPYSSLNASLFELYGGYNVSNFAVGSLAEFEVKYAGRCTAIFNGMHVLALFDVTILALAFSAMPRLRGDRIRRGLTVVAGICAFVGGVLAASKSFYYGFAVAVVVMIVLRQIRPTFGLAIWGVLAGLILVRVLQSSTISDATVDFFESVRVPTFDSALGSRFGKGGFLRSTLDAFVERPSILMVGAGSDDPTLTMADSAYVGLIVIGGIPLLLLFYGGILAFGRDAIRRTLRGESRLAPIVVLLMAFFAAGVGVPTFQTGRIAPLVFVLMFTGLWGAAPQSTSEAAPALVESGGRGGRRSVAPRPGRMVGRPWGRT
jgi:hypothetical protein